MASLTEITHEETIQQQREEAAHVYRDERGREYVKLAQPKTCKRSWINGAPKHNWDIFVGDPRPVKWKEPRDPGRRRRPILRPARMFCKNCGAIRSELDKS